MPEQLRLSRLGFGFEFRTELIFSSEDCELAQEYKEKIMRACNEAQYKLQQDLTRRAIARGIEHIKDQHDDEVADFQDSIRQLEGSVKALEFKLKQQESSGSSTATQE